MGGGISSPVRNRREARAWYPRTLAPGQARTRRKRGAVTMVLEAVYEQDFMDCSYGFRPGRSALQALEAVREGLTAMRGGWVLEVDIKSFFDHLDRGHLRSFLDQRVRDGVLRRAIDKWLKAGVVEDGHLRRFEAGTPQGGVISPLMANVYLHHVLDAWFESEVRPRLRGQVFLVRYADDGVPRRRGKEADMAA